MSSFCGLPHETTSTIVGVLHIIFGTILCAAYGTAVRIVWTGANQEEVLVTRPFVEQDFVSSLGVRGISDELAKTFVMTFLVFSASKIVQGAFLLFGIFKTSLPLLRIWLVFELCSFIGRVLVFILLFTLGNCKPAMILVHTLTFGVEFYCVTLVTLLIQEITNQCKARTFDILRVTKVFES